MEQAVQLEDAEIVDSSPRVSFSRDFSTATTADGGVLDGAALRSCSSSEFSFRLSSSNIFSCNSSMVDELIFSDTIILPLPVENASSSAADGLPSAETDAPPSPRPEKPAVVKSTSMKTERTSSSSPPTPSGYSYYSFWPFGRDKRVSSSGRRTRFWPFPLLGSKSSSTDSTSSKRYYYNNNNVAMSSSKRSNASLTSSALMASNSSSQRRYNVAIQDDGNGDSGGPPANPAVKVSRIFTFLLCSCWKKKQPGLDYAMQIP